METHCSRVFIGRWVVGVNGRWVVGVNGRITYVGFQCAWSNLLTEKSYIMVRVRVRVGLGLGLGICS